MLVNLYLLALFANPSICRSLTRGLQYVTAPNQEWGKLYNADTGQLMQGKIVGLTNNQGARTTAVYGSAPPNTGLNQGNRLGIISYGTNPVEVISRPTLQNGPNNHVGVPPRNPGFGQHTTNSNPMFGNGQTQSVNTAHLHSNGLGNEFAGGSSIYSPNTQLPSIRPAANQFGFGGPQRNQMNNGIENGYAMNSAQTHGNSISSGFGGAPNNAAMNGLTGFPPGPSHTVGFGEAPINGMNGPSGFGGAPNNDMSASPMNSGFGGSPANAMSASSMNSGFGGSPANAMGASPMNSGFGGSPANAMGVSPMNPGFGGSPANAMGASPMNLGFGGSPANAMGVSPMNSGFGGPMGFGAGPNMSPGGLGMPFPGFSGGPNQAMNYMPLAAANGFGMNGMGGLPPMGYGMNPGMGGGFMNPALPYGAMANPGMNFGGPMGYGMGGGPMMARNEVIEQIPDKKNKDEDGDDSNSYTVEIKPDKSVVMTDSPPASED